MNEVDTGRFELSLTPGIGRVQVADEVPRGKRPGTACVHDGAVDLARFPGAVVRHIVLEPQVERHGYADHGDGKPGDDDQREPGGVGSRDRRREDARQQELTL